MTAQKISVADIRRRVGAGETFKAIAQALGVDERLVGRVARAYAISPPRPHSRAELAKLIERGMSAQQIADLWGIKRRTVRNQAQKAGVKLPYVARVYPDHVMARVANMRKHGYRWERICEEIGASRCCLGRALTRYLKTHPDERRAAAPVPGLPAAAQIAARP